MTIRPTAPLAVALSLLATAATFASPETIAGTRYGEGITGATQVSVADLVADPAAYDGRKVRVEGVVTDVCPKRGCWMNIGAPDGYEEVTFKVTDGVIVVPMSAKGKHTVAEGVVRKIELSLERTREYLGHLAMEKGEAFDPGSITQPKTLVRLEGTGAIIRDAR